MLRQISWLIMVGHFRSYSMSESIPLLTSTSASACERVANYTGQIGRPFSAGIMMESLTNYISGEGLQSQFPSFRYFSKSSEHLLSVDYNVHVEQDLTQFSSGTLL